MSGVTSVNNIQTVKQLKTLEKVNEGKMENIIFSKAPVQALGEDPKPIKDKTKAKIQALVDELIASGNVTKESLNFEIPANATEANGQRLLTGLKMLKKTVIPNATERYNNREDLKHDYLKQGFKSQALIDGDTERAELTGNKLEEALKELNKLSSNKTPKLEKAEAGISKIDANAKKYSKETVDAIKNKEDKEKLLSKLEAEQKVKTELVAFLTENKKIKEAAEKKEGILSTLKDIKDAETEELKSKAAFLPRKEDKEKGIQSDENYKLKSIDDLVSEISTRYPKPFEDVQKVMDKYPKEVGKTKVMVDGKEVEKPVYEYEGQPEYKKALADLNDFAQIFVDQNGGYKRMKRLIAEDKGLNFSLAPVEAPYTVNGYGRLNFIYGETESFDPTKNMNFGFGANFTIATKLKLGLGLTMQPKSTKLDDILEPGKANVGGEFDLSYPITEKTTFQGNAKVMFDGHTVTTTGGFSHKFNDNVTGRAYVLNNRYPGGEKTFLGAEYTHQLPAGFSLKVSALKDFNSDAKEGNIRLCSDITSKKENRFFDNTQLFVDYGFKRNEVNKDPNDPNDKVPLTFGITTGLNFKRK